MRTTSTWVVCGVAIVLGCHGHGGNGKPDSAVATDAIELDATVSDAPSPDAPLDAPLDAPSGPCNVLLQAGCATGEKCTWIIDSATPQAAGHIGCAPDGARLVGDTCTRNAPGVTGYDDCAKGSYCFGPDSGGSGTCKQICDEAGGTPMCGSGLACSSYDGLFGASGQPSAAGVCDPQCDPIVDNDFLGSGVRGSGCSANLGCYGYPDGRFGRTKWTCSAALNPTRFHRAACDTSVHAGDSYSCASSSGNPYLNGCAQGYEPLLLDAEGSSQIDCIAMCRPATCYNAGATGTTGGGTVTCGDTTTTASSNLTGVAPHRCDTSEIRYATFNAATLGSAGNNGEQCAFSWIFEYDANNTFVRSPTSDTVGFCIDHSKYSLPKCDLTGLGATVNGGVDAAASGCVDSVTAGAMFSGKPRHTIDLRLPYTRTAKRL